MKKVLDEFILEVKKFSIDNSWVYAIYFGLLYVIFLLEKERLLAVVGVTTLHFIADIFIMMMLSAYQKKERVVGTWYQVISMLIFLSLKIYTGIVDNSWQYLAGDPIYMLAALKNYSLDIKKRDIPVINYKSISIVALCILAFLAYLNIIGYKYILSSPSQWVQTTGIFLFGIALSVTDKPSFRVYLSIIALFLMVVGSIWETCVSLSTHHIVGLAVSYILLPLTVLIFLLKTTYQSSRTDGPHESLGKRSVNI